MKIRHTLAILAVVFLPACAGFGRMWASSCAENYGADWIVVQYRFDGAPLHCWKLKATSITNEDHSDGIYWKEPEGLVHISGWYNRVQVHGDFQAAGRL